MTSRQGKKYILIIYVYDANAIIAAPLNSRPGSHILESYTKQVEQLINRGYIPQVHWLDNETLASLKKYNRQEDIEEQLVSPHIHRVNSVEQAISAWNYHFIAGL